MSNWVGKVVRIKVGWMCAGRTGKALTNPMPGRYGQMWVGLEWDDEDDPTWEKAASLEIVHAPRKLQRVAELEGVRDGR